VRISPEQRYSYNPGTGQLEWFNSLPEDAYYGGGGDRDGYGGGGYTPPPNNWGPHASDNGNIFFRPRGPAPNFGARGTTSNTQPLAQPQVAPIFFGGGLRGYFDEKGTRNPWIFNRNVEWPNNFTNPLIRM
jgi:hypothetical protein